MLSLLQEQEWVSIIIIFKQTIYKVSNNISIVLEVVQGSWKELLGLHQGRQ